MQKLRKDRNAAPKDRNVSPLLLNNSPSLATLYEVRTPKKLEWGGMRNIKNENDDPNGNHNFFLYNISLLNVFVIHIGRNTWTEAEIAIVQTYCHRFKQKHPR